MKKIIFILAIAACGLASCNTKQNMIDTGVVNGRFDGNMYEYLKSNSYDWDSIRLMIEKADLVDVFEGTRPGYKHITFFGPTNHSIRRWMIENHPNYNPRFPDGEKYHLTVADLTKQQCEDFVMRHVIVGKEMRDDIPEGKVTIERNEAGIDEYVYVGGKVYKTELNNDIWIYTTKGTYAGMAGAGAKMIKAISLVNKVSFTIASANIEPDNGVVHSLQYNYILGQF